MLEQLLSGFVIPYGLGDEVAAFFQVLMIDLVLAGDNAVAVGLASSGLEPRQRRKVILLGLIAAVALRILFALITVQLLALIGLLLAGGILLLWVSWKLWRELREQGRARTAHAEAALSDATGVDVTCGTPGEAATPVRRKSFGQAFLQILVADVSMSLDNVLAVAGAAREHPMVLISGLLLSIALMGVAASWIARLLHRWRWIGYLGLIIVLAVALRMIWDGHRQTVVDLDRVDEYNHLVPDLLKIGPDEVKAHKAHRRPLVG